MRVRRLLIAATAAAVALLPLPALGSPVHLLQKHGVVALVDTGVNPYSPVFRDRGQLARSHPSTYLPGYPKSAVALRLSLDLPYAKAVVKDAAVWDSVEPDTLYWVPGTRLIGLIRFGSGGSSCPTVAAPPVGSVNTTSCPERPLLDDVGHGTMTASRAGGNGTSLGAYQGVRIVAIEGLGTRGVRWAADQGWIDVQSNSWLSLVPQPAEDVVGDTTASFAYAARKTLTIAASGNGAGFVTGVAPTPTYLLSTGAPGVVLVGAHDNGRVTPWSGAPAHLVADGYGGRTGTVRGTDVLPHPVACCTSAAAPYAAGVAAGIVAVARTVLSHRGTGVRDGVLARGPAGLVQRGPLRDGVFTLDELRTLLLRTASPRPAEGPHDGIVHWAGQPRPADYTEYGPGGNPYCQGCLTLPLKWADVPTQVDAFQAIGYGAADERSYDLARRVLFGVDVLPARPAEDAAYARDQQARETLG